MKSVTDLWKQITEYRTDPTEENLRGIGETVRGLETADGWFVSGEMEQQELLQLLLPLYARYETECNKKAGYPEIVALCGGLVRRYGQVAPEWTCRVLSEVREQLSEEIFEHYMAVYELQKELEKKQRAEQGAAAAPISTLTPVGELPIRLIFKTARSVVVELVGQGRYDTEEPHEIYVNGSLYETGNKVIVSLYGLLPKTEYRIQAVLCGRCSEVLTVETEPEYVTLDVRRFGAKGDGVTDDTLFLQAAILSCPAGGRVLVPEGIYRITSLFLKSGLTLELAKGAVLRADSDRTKFPVLPGRIESTDETQDAYNLGTWEGNPLDCFSGIITGIGVSDVVITGQGTIDGGASGENWWHDPKKRRIAWRPRLVFLNRCRNVVLQGITLKNSPSWNIHPYFSEQLRFIDLTVLNPADSPNTDGLDPESCSYVEIVGVYFSLGDDCIAIKSGKIYMGAKYQRPSEHLLIRQCCMRDGHGSITIGSEMAGGVKDLTVQDCKFLHTDRGLRIKTRRGRGRAAIIDGICFENITMDQVMTPIVINSFYFCDPDGHSDYVQSKEYYPVDERTPYIGELSFRNINAENCHVAAAYLYGLPEEKIKRVTLEHVSFSFARDARTGVAAMMDGAEETSRQGLIARNIEVLELCDVTVQGQDSDVLVLDGVEHLIRK